MRFRGFGVSRFRGNPIQSLWIGAELSPLARRSIASFVAHGHAFDLYAYDELGDVPAGVTLRDAAEILPRTRVFRYREHDTVAGFSNFFRYKLLLERGGWWVDTDVVCLRPFDFAGAHVFASELSQGRPAVASCVIRAPRGSPAMRQAWETCAALDPATLAWGESGPRLCAAVVRDRGLEASVQPPEAFCPVPFHRWRELLGDDALPLPSGTYAVHLWNEMWRRSGVDAGSAVRPFVVVSV